jgi:hypothetical protein
LCFQIYVEISHVYFSRATNPSQFDIEFFVNDLSKPGASTFESLGGLEYKQNVNIQLECDRRVSSGLCNYLHGKLLANGDTVAAK